jgi:hypothetical protein
MRDAIRENLSSTAFARVAMYEPHLPPPAAIGSASMRTRSRWRRDASRGIDTDDVPATSVQPDYITGAQRDLRAVLGSRKSR